MMMEVDEGIFKALLENVQWELVVKFQSHSGGTPRTVLELWVSLRCQRSQTC